ncbi:hypothetical protein [uncultured Salinisphaera sp.]|uniref:hypothetical protein n=1 Tax=uncultured Salinisphaera sp. TaxID=359372 RepID=UPI0032B1C0A3|tara:strand:+ start:628 stop:843 length:216 start_codon:yes stop_codon:yes gene_type:complete
MAVCISLLSRPEITDALWREIGRMRYQTFVRDLGWSLPANHAEAIEFDDFDDHGYTRHLVSGGFNSQTQQS